MLPISSGLVVNSCLTSAGSLRKTVGPQAGSRSVKVGP